MKGWEILRIRSLNTAEILFLKKILQKFSHFYNSKKQDRLTQATRVVPLLEISLQRETSSPGDNHRSPNIPRMMANYRMRALSQIQIEGGDRWRVISWSPCKLIPIPPIIPNLSRSLSRHLSAHRSDVYPTRGVSIKSSKQGLSLPSSLI